MAKSKYRYNSQTLAYERAELSFKQRLFKFLSYISTGLVFATVFIVLFFLLVDSPKEKRLKRELAQKDLQFKLMSERIDQMNKVLTNIQDRDDNVYRVIFEAEPIPENIRKAGFGGVNRYEDIENIGNSEVILETSQKLDVLAKQMYIQSKSLDEVFEMAKNKEKMLASIPAIMPVAGKDLTRVASGYGMRFHPILKYRRMHTGMDFTAPTGSDIHSTGNGVVEKAERSKRGYGKHVIIDHGYGYKTLYAHMSKILVRPGQKIKRGDIIGHVGNTGLSAAPHLHYEVIKDRKKINPVNFYSNDLTPAEYEEMLIISSQSNQSFD
ncbi:MAG TPA: peptidase M23 [Flavobacteriales bacterium]|jgi:murein DD-endopeptidase MepM/ murein hydrolase activator NlpD|nr:peptidase M23 [Flavobacteriales bacterium]